MIHLRPGYRGQEKMHQPRRHGNTEKEKNTEAREDKEGWEACLYTDRCVPV